MSDKPTYPIDRKLFSRSLFSVNKSALPVLLTLWVGTFLLLAYMILRWQSVDPATRGTNKSNSIIFVDDVLLSGKDLELQNTNSLINISLSFRYSSENPSEKKSGQLKPRINTDDLYNNILHQKIKKAKNSDAEGFAIKPLPE